MSPALANFFVAFRKYNKTLSISTIPPNDFWTSASHSRWSKKITTIVFPIEKKTIFVSSKSTSDSTYPSLRVRLQINEYV